MYPKLKNPGSTALEHMKKACYFELIHSSPLVAYLKQYVLALEY